jgi:hypothetical protein
MSRAGFLSVDGLGAAPPIAGVGSDAAAPPTQSGGAAGTTSQTGSKDLGTTAGVGSIAGAGQPPAAAKCGDAKLDPGEKCDGNCPNACAAPMGCRIEVLVGSVAACTAECVPRDITAVEAGDGCCPLGATNATDTDCSSSCGDGVVTGNEICESGNNEHPCPSQADCDDNDPCTMDLVTGSERECNARCAHRALQRQAENCDDHDPCTEDQSTPSTTECTYECSHSKPRQPTGSCADLDPCTDDTAVMSTTRCAVECPHTRKQPKAVDCDDNNPCTEDTQVMSTTSCTYQCQRKMTAAGTQCGSGRICNGSGQCEAPPPNCKTWLDCDSHSDACVNGQCVPAYGSCSQGCPTGLSCNYGLCVPSCSVAADCPVAPGGFRGRQACGTEIGGNPGCVLLCIDPDNQQHPEFACPSGAACEGLGAFLGCKRR